MVHSPRVVLEAVWSDEDSVAGLDAMAVDRVTTFSRQWQSASPDSPPVAWTIHESIPSHVGLGSGTQLALAVSAAFAALNGDSMSPESLARRVQRGKRSALGLHGFALGGFLVEAGKRTPDEISPLVFRGDVPHPWRWVLIRPAHAAGLNGGDETAAFNRMSPMPASLTDRLCRIVLTELIPAVQGDDFAAFSTALYDFGVSVGSYFSAEQGGVLADRRMERLAAQLRDRGVTGIAQSSWGPTIAVACENDAMARQLSADLNVDPINGEPLVVQVTSTLNSGAVIQTTC
jgi:beta-RFAP synthase